MAYTTIDKSSLHFNTKLYTGTGSSNAITGVGFQPDLLWIKSRSSTYSHSWTDAVRGKDNKIASNNSNAQYTDAGQLTSFDSDGFTLSTDAGVNNNGSTFVSWNWKANGAGSSNTDGTINSTVSVDTTSGFSIVSYTGNGTLGATVGHGLGQTPGLFITKRTSGTSSWGMYHQSTGAGGFMEMNGVSALQSNTAYFNNTAPTSSVFSIGTDSINNTSGSTYIAYCFAEKQGYSKFGSYEGNGNTDGSFVYTGFKPAFVMMKGIDSGGSDNWNTCDNKRVGYNAANWRLYPNANAGENSTSLVDLLSNGFKLKVSSTDVNASAKTYIYMAFAEEPLVSSNGVPATAR